MWQSLFVNVLLVMACAAPNVSRSEDNADPFLPAESLNLTLAAPIDSWDEAVPLGNGLLGGLLWGQNNTIRLSLDRGDLWDLRVQDEFKKPDCTWKTVQKLVAEKNQAELERRFDAPYQAPWPTKLPGGRLELTLDPSQYATSFVLDLAHAIGRAELSDGARLETFFSIAQPVALMRIPGPVLKQWRLIPTGARKTEGAKEDQSHGAVQTLGYPTARAGEDGDTKWYVQECADDFRYVVMASIRRDGDGTLLAVTITTSNDDIDPIALGKKRLAAVLENGYAEMLAPHTAWWREFWRKSRVELPELNHLRHYYLVQYLLGSASRLGAPPMPLQGVWTADNGGLPPWKGDYHHDLNTQMTYAAYQTAGRFDEGLCFLEFLWKLLPEFRAFAKSFYEAPGAAVPAVMALDGKPLGGWVMYSMQPTNAAWVGYLFYQHWLYTTDDAFLRDRAYPWCSEIGRCLVSLLKPDANGVLRLPLSSSPEIHDNSLTAWLKPNTNYDHDCMAALFAGLADMADVLGKQDEAAKWRAALAGMGPRAVDPQTHRLMLCPGENLTESHRHLAQTMSIHPFGLLNIDGTDADRAVIEATCRQYDELGTQNWCGYSFSWMACLRARVGDAENAIKNLDIYEKAFILRNGFHANGDQTKSGYSQFQYRPFTLEGNFLASQAVHEMLLQSWNGAIRVFPAVPARWQQASFDDLRTEGGFCVSAARENGATSRLKVTATRDGLVKIRDNFGGKQPVWSRPDVERVGQEWQCQLRTGETLEARL